MTTDDCGDQQKGDNMAGYAPVAKAYHNGPERQPVKDVQEFGGFVVKDCNNIQLNKRRCMIEPGDTVESVEAWVLSEFKEAEGPLRINYYRGTNEKKK